MIEDKKGPIQEKVIYLPVVMFADLKKNRRYWPQPYAALMNGDIKKYVDYRNSAEGMSK